MSTAASATPAGLVAVHVYLPTSFLLSLGISTRAPSPEILAPVGDVKSAWLFFCHDRLGGGFPAAVHLIVIGESRGATKFSPLMLTVGGTKT